MRRSFDRFVCVIEVKSPLFIGERKVANEKGGLPLRTAGACCFIDGAFALNPPDYKAGVVTVISGP